MRVVSKGGGDDGDGGGDGDEEARELNETQITQTRPSTRHATQRHVTSRHATYLFGSRVALVHNMHGWLDRMHELERVELRTEASAPGHVPGLLVVRGAAHHTARHAARHATRHATDHWHAGIVLGVERGAV